MTTKTPILWALVACCGVLGAWVALHGGWTRYSSLWAVKRTPQVVYVTNYVNAWDQPLKPLEVDHSTYRHYSNYSVGQFLIMYSNAMWLSTNVPEVSPKLLDEGTTHWTNNWIMPMGDSISVWPTNPGHYHNVYIYGSNNCVSNYTVIR